jgi:glycosyltransferase involved in cell wall biosynthesis
MKLSVVIPCYNAADTIGETLAALVDQQWSEPWEIVVVNNRSTDHSIAVVTQYQAVLPNLRVVEASARQGQAYALNVGVQQARGEAVAFCDADDVVEAGWVAAMGAALAQHDFVAARMETAQLNTSWVCRARGHPQQDGLQRYKYPPYLPHAGGGTLGVKRSVFELVGGFDEQAFKVLQDTDFCWRVQLAGVELHFVPEALIHIRFRSSLRDMYRQAKSYGADNVILYKHYRAYGMPKLSWKPGVKAWFKLLRQAPQIRSKAQLAYWVWCAGWRVGRLKSSLALRVFAL